MEKLDSILTDIEQKLSKLEDRVEKLEKKSSPKVRIRKNTPTKNISQMFEESGLFDLKPIDPEENNDDAYDPHFLLKN